MDMIAVKCRACEEVNFVPIEDRSVVQVAVPLDLYEDVVLLISKKIRSTRRAGNTRQYKRSITDEQRHKALELRAKGLTVRQVMAEMGWSLGTTARVLSGVKPGVSHGLHD